MAGSLDILAGQLGMNVSMLLVAITIFAGYFLAFVYRICLINFSVRVQHIYFVVTGVGLMVLNYGTDTYHSLVTIVFVYVLLQLSGGTMFSVVTAFVTLMGYLLVGYLHTSDGGYDLSWVLPQCILTLRLIGLVWDVYDGRQPKESLSVDQQKTALPDTPGLLEILAYSYFFSGFLVGPLFPLTRLRSLVNREFNDPSTGKPRNNYWQTLHRLALGLFYMAVFILCYNKLPTEYFLTQAFKDEAFIWKLVHVCIWFRLILSRYLGCWLTVEGSCILSGLAYNGQDPNTGAHKWDGLRNIRTTRFELGSSFQSLIDSFNTNTNQWAARYVFKRLKFLGNKSMSHMLTLAFLALWHGVYSGYFACFAFEYVTVVAERQANSLMSRAPGLERFLYGTWFRYPTWLVKKFLVTFGCAYGLLAFCLLKFEVWWQVYKDLYMCGWLFYGVVWQMFFAIVSYCTENKSRKHKD